MRGEEPPPPRPSYRSSSGRMRTPGGRSVTGASSQFASVGRSSRRTGRASRRRADRFEDPVSVCSFQTFGEPGDVVDVERDSDATATGFRSERVILDRVNREVQPAHVAAEMELAAPAPCASFSRGSPRTFRYQSASRAASSDTINTALRKLMGIESPFPARTTSLRGHPNGHRRPAVGVPRSA
jgi:hypothetical protein